MAGDWIPLETATPTKDVLFQIGRISGRGLHESLGLMAHFWCWSSGQTSTGKLVGTFLDDLPRIIGADIEFWRAVVSKNWLKETEYGLLIPRANHWMTKGAKARLQKNKRQAKWRQNVDVPSASSASQKAPTTEQNRTEQERSDSAAGSDHKKTRASDSVTDRALAQIPLIVQDTQFVGELFRRAKYRQQDGAIFWQAAALVERGLIPQHWAVDAAQATGAAEGLKNPGGYFRKSLAEHCIQGSDGLDALLKQVSLPRRHPKGPPPVFVRAAPNGAHAAGPRSISDVLKD